MPATSLISFTNLTLYRVMSIAPTRLSKVSPRIVIPVANFRAGFHKKATHRLGAIVLPPLFTNTRLVIKE